MTKPLAQAGGFVINNADIPDAFHASGMLVDSWILLQLLRSTMVWGTMILATVRLGFSA